AAPAQGGRRLRPDRQDLGDQPSAGASGARRGGDRAALRRPGGAGASRSPSHGSKTAESAVRRGTCAGGGGSSNVERVVALAAGGGTGLARPRFLSFKKVRQGEANARRAKAGDDQFDSRPLSGAHAPSAPDRLGGRDGRPDQAGPGPLVRRLRGGVGRAHRRARTRRDAETAQPRQAPQLVLR